MYIILIYDISTEGRGAWVSGKVFKTCKKYLSHVQKSVFEGEITPALLRQLQSELDVFIRKDIDSIILFSSRQKRWLEKDFWGMDESYVTSNFF